ncbi:Methylthioribose-1-phosphate isomerase [Wickerhamiella sorbophila]|uniref:Methylthioribose-1-phosphate isomerase n=1 Tax=Wickerhamiella sorbophila TaxID=45607 RepID=A0A2T0FE58_9ASCO|nr:Methylthioribose-1-phosphate isomerase [Wickerhamiella sorbophila]PRT53282.1 Methylthioribose-1-phosphate isomerase [Wickerhamiella sorbophila]
MSLEAIKYDAQSQRLTILDQLKLPHESVYVEVKNAQDGHDVIKRMVVRGAPAIAIVGALAVALDVVETAKAEPDAEKVKQYATERLKYIVTSRPTAVNLSRAATDLLSVLAASSAQSGAGVANELLEFAVKMLADDVADNKSIGSNGAEWISKQTDGPVAAVTVCNTGSLATAGYGTALGIVRSLHSHNLLKHVYALETRPYNQGARLTAYELVHDKLPATLVTDSMAASLMARFPDVKVAVVGADRVAANGDTANKIGTYQLAVLAKFHGVKFIVAAPTTSIDFEMRSGAEIVIEERPAEELTSVQGVAVAAPGIGVWNPAFDVTPANLIDAIVTEKGVVENKNGFDLTFLK